MHCVLLYYFDVYLKHGNILLMDTTFTYTLLKKGIFLLLSKQINQVIIPFKLQYYFQILRYRLCEQGVLLHKAF